MKQLDPNLGEDHINVLKQETIKGAGLKEGSKRSFTVG